MPPSRCVVQGCNNAANLKAGISIHACPVSANIRQQWVRFVSTHRSNFNPQDRFAVCSEHFENKCFSRPVILEGHSRRILPGVVPTIWKKLSVNRADMSERSRRRGLKDIIRQNTMSIEEKVSDKNQESQPEESDKGATQEEELEDNCQASSVVIISAPSQCSKCVSLKKEKKNLQSKLQRLESKVKQLECNKAENQAQWASTVETIVRNDKKEMISTGFQTDDDCIYQQDLKDIDCDDDIEDDLEMLDHADDDEKDEEKDDCTWTPEELEDKYKEAGDDNESEKPVQINLEYANRNIKEEPKGIVFLARLLLLFQHCHHCFSSKPNINIQQIGTMIKIVTTCHSCEGTFTWTSQPYLLGRFPAGNLLLSFAILTAGASINKVLLVLRHMGVLVYHFPTYYYHQRHLLIPTVVSFWRKYQDKLLNSLNGREVVIAGDGRHDSMGHSAKYGTYTIFCCTINRIIHLVVVQANECGSSNALEFEGHQRALGFLLTKGMTITAFVSDRHGSICKWMREECPHLCRQLGKPVIDHFFDLWHIAKKIQKVLIKLSKEQGCEIVGRWRKACIRHYYWSVTSTPIKMGEVIVAKFHAFLYHILNKHKDLPNPLFNKCIHGENIRPKVWFTKKSEAYEKICDALHQTSLVKGIKQSSPHAQTSCLEGYHSVINQFAPKMHAFSYLGMLSRTIMSALHFNYNLKRDSKKDDQGRAKLKVVYPKFKGGEATVREVKVEPDYDYVNDLFECLISSPREELKHIRDGLIEEVPEPLHSMLDKEDENDAKTKYLARKEKEVAICPPTCTEAELQALTTTRNENHTRKAPTCRTCGNPRKGHKKGQCVSNNSS